MFSSKLAIARENRGLVKAKVLAALLGANCKVNSKGELLWATAPGLDRLLSFWDIPNPVSSTQWALFEDRMEIRIGNDGVVYRMEYFTPVQIALHLMITLLFLSGLNFGDSDGGVAPRFLAVFAIAHLVPALLKWISFARLSRVIRSSME